MPYVQDGTSSQIKRSCNFSPHKRGPSRWRRVAALYVSASLCHVAAAICSLLAADAAAPSTLRGYAHVQRVCRCRNLCIFTF